MKKIGSVVLDEIICPVRKTWFQERQVYITFNEAKYIVKRLKFNGTSSCGKCEKIA